MQAAPGQPALTLAIEIANPGNPATPAVRTAAAEVAVGLVTHGDPSRTQMLAVEPLHEVDRDRDDLIPAIERLLAGAGRTLRDLRQIAVSIGPGGFTSTRVACATGALLADGLGIATIAVPSALVAAVHASERILERGSALATEASTAVLLASKGEAVWCALIPVGAAPSALALAARQGSMKAADQIIALKPARVLADAHLPASIRAALTAAGIPIHPLLFTAPACVKAASLCEPGDPSTLVPIYPREPEAVTLWRSRHGGSSAAPAKG